VSTAEEEGTPSAAETLREAARLMFERAHGAETPSPWWIGAEGRSGRSVTSDDGAVVMRGYVATADAAHIAGWHPAVALAVADWLDEVAGTTQYAWDTDRVRLEQHSESVRHALTTARVYLGGQP
jgi:hypothetical protein